MTNKDELLIFPMAKVTMDTYKQRFDEAKTRREQRFKDLNANYKPGSPLFVQERDKITPEFETEVKNARHELLSEFEEIMMKTVAHERGKVSVLTGNVKEILPILKYFEDIPVTVDEYGVLTESYGGKYYILDRFLERLALKNGITETNVQPSLSIKLQILNQLEANVKEYIEDYNGEDKTFIVTSSDKYIYKLEKEFTNGYSNTNINNADKAKRMVSEALNKGGSMERSVTLANMLRTSSSDMQEEILIELTERDSGILEDPTMAFTGVKPIVNDFEEKELYYIQTAQTAMNKLDNAKTEKEKVHTIFNNLDNRHFKKAIEQKIQDTGDQELKENYENMCELKAERENKQ